MSVANLNCMFRPSTIALFGSSTTPRTIGNVLAQNLFRGGFKGPVMPVHAADPAVHGVFSFRSVATLPMTPDLAVIASPPPEVPAMIAELGARGTRAAVVLSPDFDAAGTAEGAALRQAMLDAAKPYRLRVIGPACLGTMVPEIGLNASYAHAAAHPGDLAFVSQSGSLMTLMLDWAATRRVGFSLIASLGDMTDVDFGDMLDYLAFDADTRAVLLCIGHIAHPRKFMSAARAAARLKPVIVFNAGQQDDRQAGGAAPAILPSRADVYDAAFRRAGLLPVQSLADLVAAATTLGMGMRVNGDRFAVVSNGRGIGEITGRLVVHEGGRLATLSEATLNTLASALPASGGARNPINVFADATAARWCDVLGALLADREVDAIIAVNAPTAVGDTLDAPRALPEPLATGRKPLAAVWMQHGNRAEAHRALGSRRIPLYDGPGQAAEALMQLVRYRRSQDMLMQTPATVPDLFEHRPEVAKRIIRQALADGREWLSEPDAKAVLAAYGIPVLAAADADTPDQAVKVAQRLGFPVSIRPRGWRATGEADASTAGISLQSETAEAVETAALRLIRKHRQRAPDAPFPGFTIRRQPAAGSAHELQIAVANDPELGPVVLFGQGGDIAEIAPDRAVGLPPLNLNLARLLIGETRVHRLLQGYGDRPAVDLEEVALALVKIAQLAADVSEIAEVEVNPLLARGNDLLAVAVRMRVGPSSQAAEARLAIRPYPSELQRRVVTRDGRELELRPIRPEDEPALQDFVRRQSPEDRRLRFFTHVKELDHRTAARLTQIDYDREMALVLLDPQEGQPQILGVMRISADPDQARAEYAGAVRSDLKGLGLGRLLLEEIIAYCRNRGIGVVAGEVLAENAPMLRLVRSLGFTIHPDPEDRSVMHVSKPLQDG